MQCGRSSWALRDTRRHHNCEKTPSLNLRLGSKLLPANSDEHKLTRASTSNEDIHNHPMSISLMNSPCTEWSRVRSLLASFALCTQLEPHTARPPFFLYRPIQRCTQQTKKKRSRSRRTHIIQSA
eukprot:895998-Rhodomonas_salina.3